LHLLQDHHPRKPWKNPVPGPAADRLPRHPPGGAHPRLDRAQQAHRLDQRPGTRRRAPDRKDVQPGAPGRQAGGRRPVGLPPDHKQRSARRAGGFPPAPARDRRAAHALPDGLKR